MRYSRQLRTGGISLGHGGYGGQYMVANPDTDTVVVYFSVLENDIAADSDFSDPLARMTAATSMPRRCGATTSSSFCSDLDPRQARTSGRRLE